MSKRHWLKITLVEAGSRPSQNRWLVEHKDGTCLGQIVWHNPWRQYVFETGATFWSAGCLEELADFLNKLKQARKEKLNATRTVS